MCIIANMRQSLLLLLILGLLMISAAPNVQEKIQIRIRNSSTYDIAAVKLLGIEFQNIHARTTTEYKDVDPFYPSFTYQISFQCKKRTRCTISSTPIDHVGEHLTRDLKNTVTIDIEKRKSGGGSMFDADVEVSAE